MNSQPRSSLSSRAMAAFGVTLGLFVMLISGVMLVFAPSGRVARDLDWQFLGASRDVWQHIHLVSALGFGAVALWHMILHLPIYRNLLGGTRAHPYGNRLDAGLMALIAFALVATAILDLPPSSWLADLNHYFKTVYWRTN